MKSTQLVITLYNGFQDIIYENWFNEVAKKELISIFFRLRLANLSKMDLKFKFSLLNLRIGYRFLCRILNLRINFTRNTVSIFVTKA